MSRGYTPRATDCNQVELSDLLRSLGYSVSSLHTVGNGIPDLLIGGHGLTFIAEVKDGSNTPSARMLNPEQRRWWRNWFGQVCVLACPADVAIFHESVERLVGAMRAAGIIPAIEGNSDPIYMRERLL